MKQFANNAADSTYIPSTSTGINGVEVMSFRKGNKLIVWITNGTDSSVSDITVNLNGARFANNQIDRLTWASWSGAIGYSSIETVDSDAQFTTSIGSKVIASYVFEID